MRKNEKTNTKYVNITQNRNKSLFFLFLLIFCISCQQFFNKKYTPADMILLNGIIHTVDKQNPRAEAIAIKADTFLYVGSAEEVKKYQSKQTHIIDLQGKTVIPGLTESHAHIMGVGYNLLNVDLRNAKSYDEVVEMVKNRAKITPKGTWIIGRGWHQEKWNKKPKRMIKDFPTHNLLTEKVSEHPVWLKHASGHVGLANELAMKTANISKKTRQRQGGEFFIGSDGKPSGIFNETAQQMITKYIPKNLDKTDTLALELALKECFKHGITGFHQAGSGKNHIDLFKSFAKKNKLQLRLYVMLDGSDHSLLDEYFAKGIEENSYNNQITIRAVKLYMDGALGSRGAWLLKPYHDATDTHGHNIMSVNDIANISTKAYSAGFQMCVHAIGDRANREVLDVFEQLYQNESKTITQKPRFRIEHVQHLHPDDIPRFAQLGVIASMQAVHMASDRPWAIDRLGEQRIKWGAYVWQDLLQSGARVINGTDSPVEPLNTIANFYVSVTRKNIDGQPKGGYEPKQKMTRKQALNAYTIHAAYAAFQEKEKGTIEVGKWADLTILNKDILSIPEEDILKTKVEMTIIGGKIVFSK